MLLKELKESRKKVIFEKIIPHAKQFIRASVIFISAAIALLTYYLVSSDFSNHYVWQYTSKDLPVIYKISAVWTGEAGSLMFLAWMIMVMAFWISERHGQEVRFKRKIQIIILIMGLLFLALTVLISPFAHTMEGNIPEDGHGLNPLLVNKWMIFHPPGIFIPYAILAVVFACAAVFLLDGDKEWEKFSRPYARAAWIILGAGMVAGVIWSYEVWENYWIWDPAFTSILMTWLLLTAYLHSSIMYRRNWTKLLAPALALNSFILSLYSTYIIRSGTIKSAHSFGEASQLIPLLLILILISIISEGLILYRYFSVKKDTVSQEKDIFSNKNLFYLMIILLAGLSFILFWGLTASLLLETLGASVSIDLYREWSYPLTIALLAVLGICMFAAKGKKMMSAVIISAFFVIAVILLKPTEDFYTNLSISFLVLTGISSAYRIIRISPVKGNKLISYSPHIVHIGIIIMLSGILMSSYATSETVLFMKFNEKKSVGGYEIQLTDLAYPVEHKHTTAVLTKIGTYNIYKDGVIVGSGEARFREINGEFITEPFIYRGLFSDVNVRYQGIGTRDQIFISVANIRVIPGMTILWAGSILVVAGILPLLFKKK
ncbi:MAG TPA: cytochrome c biogenesis protein CcsA [Candidatus Limnocylindrales bacterium]|nr:cytochrome c biogenesis protein CcsA [Candidatus Limnocylindrales bacterium]